MTSALAMLEVLVVPLRAQYSTLRTPDTLQLAAAIGMGCATFVANDRRMPSPDGLRILQLSEWE